VFVAEVSDQLIAGVIACALGLIVASLVLIVNHRRVVRVRGSGRSPLLRKGTVCLAAPRASAVDFIVEAARKTGGEVTSRDPDKGQVVAKYGMTFRSYGQYLQIDLWDTDLGEQQCVCTSWPTQDFVVTEWGAGTILIDRFIEKLGEMTPSGTVVGTITAGHTLDS
jgi:hypothetical protein